MTGNSDVTPLGKGCRQLTPPRPNDLSAYHRCPTGVDSVTIKQKRGNSPKVSRVLGDGGRHSHDSTPIPVRWHCFDDFLHIAASFTKRHSVEGSFTSCGSVRICWRRFSAGSAGLARFNFDPTNVVAFRHQHPEGDNIVLAHDVERAFTRNYGDLRVRVDGIRSFADSISS
jgi:hypothetical protein